MTSRDWTIVVLVILGVFVLLPILGMGFGGFGMMGGGMMGPGMMGGYGGGFRWGGLLFIALVVVGIVLIARGLLGRPGTGTGSDGALEILRQRLAKGEITKEQYEELRKTLQ